MPKMTTEQFSSHLGIEVGKPFNAKGKRMNGIYVIVHFEETEGCKEHYTVFDFDMDNYEDGYGYSLEVLLDCEITPLPKYTLTEDEKNFVKITTIKWLMRKFGYLINGGNELELYIDNSLFPFIKNDEKIDIDELRKCL